MRATFTDPQGSMMWRVLPFLGPVATFFFACFGLVNPWAWALAFLSLGGLNLLGAMPFSQRKPREVELELQPGFVRIKKAGSRNQKIRTRDIVGATTTRTRDGILLTFQHAMRAQPITLTVANDADANAVRRALGIGHSGFGTIAWRTIANGSTQAMIVSRAIAAVSFLACVVLGLASVEGLSVLAGILAFSTMVAGVIAWLGKSTDPSIVMTAEGLRLRTPHGWFALPYENVMSVTDHRGAIQFGVPAPYLDVRVQCAGPTYAGLSDADRAVVIKQIEAAGQRARGLGPQKNDASARVELLRRNGATPRDWLMRLDMQGQMLSSSGVGYRGHTLDAEDLWTILEDPEADPELRTAAARVLKHAPQPEARPRIDAAVAAIRDDSVNKRLRIAVQDDVETASRELATLEQEEIQARYIRQLAHLR